MSAASGKKQGDRLIAANKKARHNYHIEETVEAGLVLRGSEVKALREGKGSFNDAYAHVERDEMWLTGLRIAPYSNIGYASHDPERPKKLLLHRREIDRLATRIAQAGTALVPLEAHWKDGRAKVVLGLGKGKKLYDKRETEKERNAQRDMDRAMRRNYR